jgi:hypothetical protein
MVNFLLIPRPLNGRAAIRRALHASGEGLAVTTTLIRTCAVGMAALAAAASLAGCATSPRPFSIEEKIWFDKALGHDFLPVYPYPPHGNGPPGYAPDLFAPPVRYRG